MQFSYNVSAWATPPEGRCAERPAGQARFIRPQIRAAAGGKARGQARPRLLNLVAARSARCCVMCCSKRPDHNAWADGTLNNNTFNNSL
jgi:hypothetical protein